jgi:Flp pilus assembly protein TadB
VDTAVITKLAGLLIPIVGILLPIFIVGIVLYFKQRQREALYETVKHFADRGMPVPRELLDPPQPPGQSALGTPRFRAITLIGVGIGLALLFWSLDLVFLIGIGGLLVCIGLAQLFALKLDARDEARLQRRSAGGLEQP